MAEVIKIYKITKRTNSTKQPTDTNLIGTHDVTLKDGSSIINPIFELSDTSSFARLSRCNYLEWLSDLTGDNTINYYWIDEISVDYDNYITIRCHRDPLATFKSSITGYNGFVARSDTNYDTMIDDPNILTKPILVNKYNETFAIYKHPNSTALAFSWKDSEVSYTWTTIGTEGCSIFNSNSTPNTTLYEMLNMQGGSSIWNNFEWGVTNPGQYVKDCIMLPFAFDATDYGQHKIYIGNLTATMSDIYIWEGEATQGGTWSSDSPDRFYQVNCAIPLTNLKASFAYPVTDFRNYSDKFTNCKLRLPFVGMVQVPAKHLNATRLGVQYDISAMTGKGKCQLVATYVNDDVVIGIDIGTYNIEAGQPVSVAQGHTNMLQQARDAIEVVRTAGDIAGAVTKPTPAGVINATANVASTALETAAHAAAGYQEYTSFGSNGSLAEVFTEYRSAEVFLQQYASTSTDFTAERGRPVYLKRTNLAGFVQFLSPSVHPTGALQSEIETINATLASGIYIE